MTDVRQDVETVRNALADYATSRLLVLRGTPEKQALDRLAARIEELDAATENELTNAVLVAGLTADRDKWKKYAEQAYAERGKAREALRRIYQRAFSQHLDWMHFHETAMQDPFKAERLAQAFAADIARLADTEGDET